MFTFERVERLIERENSRRVKVRLCTICSRPIIFWELYRKVGCLHDVCTIKIFSNSDRIANPTGFRGWISLFLSLYLSRKLFMHDRSHDCDMFYRLSLSCVFKTVEFACLLAPKSCEINIKRISSPPRLRFHTRKTIFTPLYFIMLIYVLISCGFWEFHALICVNDIFFFQITLIISTMHLNLCLTYLCEMGEFAKQNRVSLRNLSHIDDIDIPRHVCSLWNRTDEKPPVKFINFSKLSERTFAKVCSLCFQSKRFNVSTNFDLQRIFNCGKYY